MPLYIQYTCIWDTSLVKERCWGQMLFVTCYFLLNCKATSRCFSCSWSQNKAHWECALFLCFRWFPSWLPSPLAIPNLIPFPWFEATLFLLPLSFTFRLEFILVTAWNPHQTSVSWYQQDCKWRPNIPFLSSFASWKLWAQGWDTVEWLSVLAQLGSDGECL